MATRFQLSVFWKDDNVKESSRLVVIGNVFHLFTRKFYTAKKYRTALRTNKPHAAEAAGERLVTSMYLFMYLFIYLGRNWQLLSWGCCLTSCRSIEIKLQDENNTRSYAGG